MAYKPSMRRKGQDLDMDLDIRPVMNLMVVLIPLLLAGVEYVKLSIIEIDLPPTAANVPGDGQQKPQQEKEKKLNLSVAVTNQGITITSAFAVLSGENDQGPTIPINADGKYDFKLLKEKLKEIKKQIADKGFKDQESAVITASSEVEYQVIVDIMDTLQTYEDEDGSLKPLFPQINFGQIIV